MPGEIKFKYTVSQCFLDIASLEGSPAHIKFKETCRSSDRLTLSQMVSVISDFVSLMVTEPQVTGITQPGRLFQRWMPRPERVVISDQAVSAFKRSPASKDSVPERTQWEWPGSERVQIHRQMVSSEFLFDSLTVSEPQASHQRAYLSLPNLKS